MPPMIYTARVQRLRINSLQHSLRQGHLYKELFNINIWMCSCCFACYFYMTAVDCSDQTVLQISPTQKKLKWDQRDRDQEMTRQLCISSVSLPSLPFHNKPVQSQSAIKSMCQSKESCCFYSSFFILKRIQETNSSSTAAWKSGNSWRSGLLGRPLNCFVYVTLHALLFCYLF